MNLSWLRKHRIIIGDVLIAFGAVWISFVLRVGVESISEFLSHVWLMSLLALVVKPMIFQITGIYRIFWKYAASKEYLRLLSCSLIATISLSIPILVFSSQPFPRSVFAIDWFISSIAFVVYRSVAYAHYKSKPYQSFEDIR
jgi:FlaA1/EpsC-like NDP-sugar epimerase